MVDYKKIIKMSITVLIIVIILILAILFLKKNAEKKEEYKNYEAEEELGIDKSLRVRTVDSPTMFYTVQNVVQKYLSYVHLDYEKQEQDDPNIEVDALAKTYGISNIEQKKEAIIKFLDVDYVKEKNINPNNLEKNIVIDNDELENISAIAMNVLEDEQFHVYSVQIKTVTASGKQSEEFYVVTLDEYNSTYMIKPINDCKDINEIKIEEVKDIDKIENNQINIYSYVRVNDSEMCQKYFKEYKELMLNNPEEAYDKLSEEYKNKRFGSYENFERYINNNKEEISKLYVSKYLVNDVLKYKEYVCKDGFQNVYVFKATGVKEYKVELDTYTIVTSKFKETYEAASDKDKVAMNIDKWVDMLNNRDYQAAYNVLDETFRNENFGSVESFEAYMREQYPLHYAVYQEDMKKESNAYVRKVVLVDITGATNLQNENNIIMQLKQGTDFVMSFYVRRH